MPVIPKSLQAVLWSKSIDNLDLKQDKTYIVHQVLNYGNLGHIKWLKNTYPLATIHKEFLENPLKLYSPSSLNFVKNYLLGLEDIPVNEEDYLKTTPRHI